MRFRRSTSVPTLVPVLAVIAATVTASLGWPQTPAALSTQQFVEMDSSREQGQRATDILKALAVSPGDQVADVGAGNGYYSSRLSEAVGPAGKVFAEEISDYMVNLLEQRVKLFALKNVEV